MAGPRGVKSKPATRKSASKKGGGVKKGAASSVRKRNPLKSIENNAFDFNFDDAAEPKKQKRGIARKAVTSFAQPAAKKTKSTKAKQAKQPKQGRVTKARTEPKPKSKPITKTSNSKAKNSRKKRKHQSAKKHADAFVDKAPPTQVATPRFTLGASPLFSPGDASCESAYSVKSKRRLRTSLGSPATPTAHLAFEVSLKDLRDTPTRELKAGKGKKKTQEKKKMQREKRSKVRKTTSSGANKSSDKLELSAVSGYGSFISPARHLSSLSQSKDDIIAPSMDDMLGGAMDDSLSLPAAEELKVEIPSPSKEEGEQEAAATQATQADISPTALLMAEHKEQRRKKNSRVKPILNEAQMAELLEQAKEEEEKAKRFYEEVDDEPLESFFEVC